VANAATIGSLGNSRETFNRIWQPLSEPRALPRRRSVRCLPPVNSERDSTQRRSGGLLLLPSGSDRLAGDTDLLAATCWQRRRGPTFHWRGAGFGPGAASNLPPVSARGLSFLLKAGRQIGATDSTLASAVAPVSAQDRWRAIRGFPRFGSLDSLKPRPRSAARRRKWGTRVPLSILPATSCYSSVY